MPSFGVVVVGMIYINCLTSVKFTITSQEKKTTKDKHVEDSSTPLVSESTSILPA
jgi:hypothetical protein